MHDGGGGGGGVAQLSVAYKVDRHTERHSCLSQIAGFLGQGLKFRIKINKN